MATCVSCGDELHPERAERYDYCMKPQCVERNARGLEIVAVGVNKAAEQYVALTERTKQDMARGRYKKQPEASSPVRHSPPRQAPTPGTRPVPPTRAPARSPRRRWSQAQENLAVIYRDMGMKPDAIAQKLGVSPYLVTQILLAATRTAKR